MDDSASDAAPAAPASAGASASAGAPATATDYYDEFLHQSRVSERAQLANVVIESRALRDVKRHHARLMWVLTLVFGTVACRVMWMWKDSYGSSGLGLDVTMAEAYVRSPTHYLPFLCTGVCCGVLQL